MVFIQFLWCSISIERMNRSFYIHLIWTWLAFDLDMAYRIIHHHVQMHVHACTCNWHHLHVHHATAAFAAPEHFEAHQVSSWENRRETLQPLTTNFKSSPGQFSHQPLVTIINKHHSPFLAIIHHNQ